MSAAAVVSAHSAQGDEESYVSILDDYVPNKTQFADISPKLEIASRFLLAHSIPT